MGGLTRYVSYIATVGVDTNLADCEPVPFGSYAGGRVYIPSGSSITSLTFYDAPASDGTYLASYDDTATTPVAITLTGLGASKSYPIPAKMFGANWIKMVGNADGTVHLSLKG